MSESMLRGTARGGASRALRWGVPLGMVSVGTLLVALFDSTFAVGVGVSLLAGSVLVAFTGWFARLGDDSERVREIEAREQYLETGRWPDADEASPEGDAGGRRDPGER